MCIECAQLQPSIAGEECELSAANKRCSVHNLFQHAVVAWINRTRISPTYAADSRQSKFNTTQTTERNYAASILSRWKKKNLVCHSFALCQSASVLDLFVDVLHTSKALLVVARVLLNSVASDSVRSSFTIRLYGGANRIRNSVSLIILVVWSLIAGILTHSRMREVLMLCYRIFIWTTDCWMWANNVNIAGRMPMLTQSSMSSSPAISALHILRNVRTP